MAFLFKPRSILRRGIAALALLSCATHALAASATELPQHLVEDPHYGDSLFYFFQDQYFKSVTTLMVSQHFKRVTQHADEADVLRGGLLLSYGLHRQAGEIFSKLIAQGTAPAVRDRAWYFLAKIRYQRGYLEQAQQALNQIGDQLAADLQEDLVLLQSNLLMARADYAAAAKLLAAVDGKSDSARYARYNLGVALIKAGESSRGNSVLDALGQTPADNEEQRSLRDRSNVALGFAALSKQQPEVARSYLERVRLQGVYSNKALLGLGWAAQALKQPEQALNPWLELAQREVSDSAVLEAQIALPFAYTELGSHGQALERYNQAINGFALEHAALDQSIAVIRSGTLVDGLVARNPGTEMGWFWKMNQLPEFAHAHHLASLLAQHEFQEAIKNYRDLRFLAQNLTEWQDKLVVFDDMLINRRARFAQRLPLTKARVSQTRYAALAERRSSLSAEVTEADAAADGTAFANAKQLALMSRLATVRKAVAGTNPDLDLARERLRLASGALTWQLAQDFSERRWTAQKDLKVINTQLDLAQRRDTELGQAQQHEPQRFDAFGTRIATMAPRLQALSVQVASLSAQQKTRVQDIAVAELTRQQERLAEYASQARFAVAQLYDRASDAAAKPADPATEASHANQP
jgi:hypothetical protein